jgi:hypothetical protein
VGGASNGPRDQLGLLFVVSESAVESHWSDVGLTSGSINQSFIDHIDRTKVPATGINRELNYKIV